ncbi:MAG TPA: tRNA (N6-threonylcarbamoyladenosine(37)-N6)-methyltransferase TrmO [Hyphomicrobiales bacterium]|nr:tRNA (N6-threonylcarbamoyladenosine(37)-N6)-methyltransferase TrmO [Hyphomicrobiales bacterium]
MAGEDKPPRPGEVSLGFDPGAADDARLAFIGRLRTPWRARADCPRNGRKTDAVATVEIDPPFRAALTGIGRFSHLILLYWMDEARRDLVVQVPGHSEGEPRGTFALRSPVRPNPIALSVVDLLGVDQAAGRLEVRGLDCRDGTPLLDVKPYFPSVDAWPDARTDKPGGS